MSLLLKYDLIKYKLKILKKKFIFFLAQNPCTRRPLLTWICSGCKWMDPTFQSSSCHIAGFCFKLTGRHSLCVRACYASVHHPLFFLTFFYHFYVVKPPNDKT